MTELTGYTRHTWECGETITDEKMNNIEDGIEEALACCDGSSGYDFIIRKNNNDDPAVIQGDFGVVYDKVTNHEYVNGVFIHTSDYADADIMHIYPLYELGTIANSSPRRMNMKFTTTRFSSSTEVISMMWEVEWDENDSIDYSNYYETAIVSANAQNV